MNQFDHDYNTVAELAACIKEGRYHIKVSPCLETKVKAATWVKKILKQSGNVIVK